MENKISNFDKTPVNPQSELSIQTLKDPYVFDFVILAEDAKEKDLEAQLIKHINFYLN